MTNAQRPGGLDSPAVALLSINAEIEKYLFLCSDGGSWRISTLGTRISMVDQEKQRTILCNSAVEVDPFALQEILKLKFTKTQ